MCEERSAVDAPALLVEQLQQTGGSLGEEVEAARVVDELDVLPLDAFLNVLLLHVRVHEQVHRDVEVGATLHNVLLRLSLNLVRILLPRNQVCELQ